MQFKLFRRCNNWIERNKCRIVRGVNVTYVGKGRRLQKPEESQNIT